MIDKESQMIQISLKEYEELLELKWVFSHSTNKPDEICSSILSIISKRIKIDTYDNSIVPRNYSDAEKILKEITELFKYVNPELYEKLDDYKGKKVVLVDTDIGLRNLDVVMGLENRIVYDIVDVVEGTCKLKQALIK